MQHIGIDESDLLGYLGSMQSEVGSFAQRVAAAGGTIDALTLYALDRFVVRGKAFGWWSKLDEIWPFVGGQFAAATQKLKYYSTAALTNVGIPESAYSQRTGITTSAIGQYLTTGYNPVTAGRTVNDICIGGIITGLSTQTTGGYAVGNIGTSSSDTETPLFFGNIGCGLSQTASFTIGIYNTFYPKALGASYGAGGIHNFVQNGMPSVVIDPATHGGNIDSELQIFRNRRYATIYYDNLPLGMFYAGQYLTQAEQIDLQNAAIELQVDIGRVVYQDYKSAICLFGDSNTSGQGANRIAVSYASKVQKGLTRPVVITGCNSKVFDSNDVSVTSKTAFKSFIFALGTNNISGDADTNGNATTIANFKTAIISTLAPLHLNRSCLVLGPMYRQTTGSTPTKCRAYNVAAKEAADEYGFPFLDVDQAFRDNPTADADYMVDVAHLSQAGHDYMAKLVIGGANGIHTRSIPHDFGSISSGSSATQAFTWLDADIGDSISVSARSLEPGLVASAYVSADSQITLRVTNGTAGSVNPASQNYEFTLIKSR